MKISREWLQTFFDHPLSDVKELGHALTFHAFEIEEIVGDVLDVKVTPNRGHDCLSHRGIAKEISAILNIPLRAELSMSRRRLDSGAKNLAVTIEDAHLCPRYIAGYIKGVKVRPSPDWLQKRLHAMGQHSINNIVDATNFIMFNIGQPLHAFDAGKLTTRGPTSGTEVGPRYAISVRNAKKVEKMTALDGKEYTLSESMLVIADENGDVPIGIAGVKGGVASGIDESTTDIIIEAANFNGASIRKTAQALKLRTDASQRFEQVISSELAADGMRAVIDLILQLAGGELIGFKDEYPKREEKRMVSVTASQVNKLLGTAYMVGDIEGVFKRLDFPYTCQDNILTAEVPFERLDITIPEDLIEEVGRIIGYQTVEPKELSLFSKAVDISTNFYWSERVREDMVAVGYSEVYTSVFAEKGERAVLNKVGGDRPSLRANVTDGLTVALKKNIQNKDLLGLKEVKLFEIGTVWNGVEEIMMVGTASEKGKVSEKPLAEYVKDKPLRYADLSLSEADRFQQFSKYPYIVRDIAMWVPFHSAEGKPAATADEILGLIRHSAGELLIRVDLFDQFEKADKTSLAFRLIFQSFDKTLTDDDANHRMESIYKALKELGYEIR